MIVSIDLGYDLFSARRVRQQMMTTACASINMPNVVVVCLDTFCKYSCVGCKYVFVVADTDNRLKSGFAALRIFFCAFTMPCHA